MGEFYYSMPGRLRLTVEAISLDDVWLRLEGDLFLHPNDALKLAAALEEAARTAMQNRMATTIFPPKGETE